jgi:hypothetical protein
MANRRMFSLKVIDTDSFLDMSPTAQLLYFHLAMRADDDGFVASPKKIMKMANGADDDMKVLIIKKYVIPFESGVCVIKDWKIHNYIQTDRYSETEYREEKAKLIENNGKYELKDKCIQDGYSLDTQVRLGKSKDRKEIGEIAEASSAPWSLEDKLQGMEKKEGGYLDFIASFIREKPVKVENAKQLSGVISRYCRIAKQLEGAYAPKQVFDAIDEIKKDNERRRSDKVDWTLETVFKKLTK